MTQDPRRPTETDVAIGQQIRAHRHSRGMGQEDLASFLGVTVQQIQKYETGFSRIGAGRLQQIATKLSVSVSSLFNTEVGTDKPKIVQQAMADATLAADCAELNRAFQRISDPGTRQKLVALAVAVSRDDEASGV